MKLPLTIALERDNIDLQVVRRLYEAYPQALSERGAGGGGGSGSKLPLQILVENYLHTPTANLAVIDFIARQDTGAILSTSTAVKRDSPMLLALDRNIFEVSRRLLILCPTYNPTLLRNAHWKARKIAFVLAKKQIFRPSVLQRLAQLASGGSAKSADSPNPGNVSPTSSLRLFQSALNSVTAATVSRSGAAAQSHSGSNYHLKPRRRKNSGNNTTNGSGSGGSGATVGLVTTFAPISSPTFNERKSLPGLFYPEQLHLPHLSPLSPLGLEMGVGLGSWSGDDSVAGGGAEGHNIYESPSSRQSNANSPRNAAAPVNFYLRLYKTNSDAFRLAVTFL